MLRWVFDGLVGFVLGSVIGRIVLTCGGGIGWVDCMWYYGRVLDRSCVITLSLCCPCVSPPNLLCTYGLLL